jgi:alkyldihydroxyacetonephosphate synthase
VIELDKKSLLVNASGDVTVRALEDAMAAAGLTLDLGSVPGTTTVKALVEGGFRGARAPWGDPADHLVAGVVAREQKGTLGRSLILRPVPRRAVGPDLFGLVVGGGGRFYAVESAWLRVHHRNVDDGATRAVRPAPIPFTENEPPLTADEEELWSRIDDALAVNR